MSNTQILWDISFSVKDKQGRLLSSIHTATPTEQTDHTFKFIAMEIQRLGSLDEPIINKPKRGRPRKIKESQ